MSKNSLEILFESKARLKILKFMFRNHPKIYTAKEIGIHVQEKSAVVRKELRRLKNIELVVSKNNSIGLNKNFEYFGELRELVLKAPASEKKDLLHQINKLGKIRLAIISGVFLDKEVKDPLAVDLFLAHDFLDRRKLKQFLKNLESEVGKEIRFATMEKEEFKYRFSMFDRFVRVLLESPHEKLINKLGIE